MGSAGQLKVPKAELPKGRDCSPKSVLRQAPIHLSFSSESEDGSRRSYESDASSNHSDRSDSEEDYEVDSDDEEEEEEGSRSPRAKKRKFTATCEERLPTRKKSRTKTTAKRSDCYAPMQRRSNPGRRRVGGRIYDSVLGRTCHWCRQKTVEVHVECSRCPIRFCGPCLLNRNGEVVLEETMKNVRWVCPKCRGGCGPGCKNCCNCGPCRKVQGMGPTGQLIMVARRAGFSNAHDYLVHLKTKENPEVISVRKEGRGWTRATGALRPHSDWDEEDVKFKDFKEEVHEEGAATKMVASASEGDDRSENTVRRMRGTADPRKLKGDSIRVKDEPEEQMFPEVLRKKRFQRITRSDNDLSGTKVKRRHSINKSPAEELISFAFTEDSAYGHGPSSCCTEGHEFARKLALALQRPFSTLQLKEMLLLVEYRKPIMKTRLTRSRVIEVPCSIDGLSYLDHYPDLKEKLGKAISPEEKLRLLRGFFFWLQHSCMDGAVRPWATTGNGDDTEECMEISGPDCQIIKVLLAVDEDEDHFPEWEDKKPVIPAQKRGPPQSKKDNILKPNTVKVKIEKED